MKDVLISAPYMLPFMQRFTPVLEQLGMRVIIPEVHERLSEEELLAYAGQFDGTICGDDRYTRRVIQACQPRLKVISKWGTGIDSIDQEAAAEFGVSVRNTPNAFTVPVAESVLGYMLSFARRFGAMDSAMKAAGEWKKIPGYTLSEKTLGVVGVGNVGKAVLRRARAFGMKLLGNDIVEIAPWILLEKQRESVPLRELLSGGFYQPELFAHSVVISSNGMKTALGGGKPGAVLINTSCGPRWRSLPWVRALQSGRAGWRGAGRF